MARAARRVVMAWPRPRRGMVSPLPVASRETVETLRFRCFARAEASQVRATSVLSITQICREKHARARVFFYPRRGIIIIVLCMTQPAILEYLREVLRVEVEKEGLRPFAAKRELPLGQVRGLLHGQSVLSTTIEAACEALGLEFYVGPPRDESSTSPEVADATPDVAPDWAMEMQEELRALKGEENLANALQAEIAGLKAELAPAALSENLSALRSGLREDLAASIQKLTEDLSDETATAVEGSPSRPVVTYELAAAAGGGAMELDETPTGIVYFRYDWLTQHGLDAKQCCVMGVVGESMETMLPDGCAILVNRRSGIRRRVDHLYVVINDLGLIVKRAGKDENGQWLLVSDHPAWEPVLWGDAQMIGEVKWMARTL